MSASNMKWIQSPYFATGDPETEELTTLYAPGMLGCCAQFDRGGINGPQNVCTYQLVKQGAGVAGLAGQVFSWNPKSTWTVVLAAAAQLGQIAGVGEKVVATAATYIWIVKKGDRPVLVINAPTVAPDATGLPVVSSATAGSADCVAATTAGMTKFVGATLGAQDGVTKLTSVRINIVDQF